MPTTTPIKPPQRSGWKKLPEAVRRRAILDAARTCFGKRGYAESSVQDIADAAAMTKGGVYFHFPSKEAIRDTLIAEFTDSTRFGLDDPEITRLPPAQRLRQQVERLLNGLEVDGNGAIVTLAEAATRYGAGLADIGTFFKSVRTSIAATLEAGQQDGVFRRDADTDLLAELVITTVDGLALHHELDAAGLNMCSGPGRLLDLVIASVATTRGR